MGVRLYLKYVSTLRCPFCRCRTLNNVAGRENVIIVSEKGRRFASATNSWEVVYSVASTSAQPLSLVDALSAAQPCTNANKQTMGIMYFCNSFIILNNDNANEPIVTCFNYLQLRCKMNVVCNATEHFALHKSATCRFGLFRIIIDKDSTIIPITK